MTAFLLRATACIKVSGTLGGTPALLPDADAPVIQDLGHGLCAAYLVDEGGHLAYVQHQHLATAQVRPEGLYEMGLINLGRLAEDKLRIVDQGAIHGLLLDGQFEASLMLLGDLWDDTLAQYTPNGAVVALPARDILAFCDANSAQGITELNQLVAKVMPRCDHPLTGLLYRRESGGWRPAT